MGAKRDSPFDPSWKSFMHAGSIVLVSIFLVSVPMTMPHSVASPSAVGASGDQEAHPAGPVVFDDSVERRANSAAAAEADAGKRDTVNAAWWGFSEADATAALQSALDSGAKRVLVPNMGKPWIVEPISLRSDQEVVFEEGVVVLAKRGSYRGVADMLFTARGEKDIVLRGYGATFRMHREDYASGDYPPAEWRHTLGLLGSSNVTVLGLTFEDSGGDGIYLGAGTWKRPGYGPFDAGLPGYCSNIHIRDVVADRNHRQGCSVVSAQDVLIEGSRFVNTKGAPPEAGIDFEPNAPANLLTNIVVRDCVFEDNAGSGVEFHFGKLSTESTPVSIRFERITTRRNKHDVYFSSTLSGDNMPPGSRLLFSDTRDLDLSKVGLGVRVPRPSTLTFGTPASAEKARAMMPNIEVRFDAATP